MKTTHTLTQTICVLAIATAIVGAGCSKKKEATMTPSVAPAAPATPAALPTATASQPAADPAKTASDLATATKQEAEAGAKTAAEETRAAMDGATMATKQTIERAPDAVTPATPSPAASSIAAAAGGMDALNAQAEQLLSEYSGQLTTLKSGAAALKSLIDKNAAMLPAGVTEKYQALNTLLPQLTTAVDSLRNYQTADLTTLVPKLKADFATAQKLYTEIKGMLPAM